jgi:NADH dehydrogenase [ubiquinone] 1 alpha subcomplex assembly factor 7
MLKSEDFSTRLEEDLYRQMSLSGPISLSRFISLALTHPMFGYYTSSADILGERGDFTTSPEISQLFGEMCALYFCSLFRTISPLPKALRVVELGPGKGTLMADMLRTFNQFDDIATAIKSGGVYLVEKGPTMRLKQAECLGCDLAAASFDLLVDETPSKDYESMDVPQLKQELADMGIKIGNKSKEGLLEILRERRPPKPIIDADRNKYLTSAVASEAFGSVPVTWVSSLADIPSDVHSSPPEFIIAQELLDALPIHAFQTDGNGKWRERMVDVNRDFAPDTTSVDTTSVDSTASSFSPTSTPLKMVLAPAVTPGLQTLLRNLSAEGVEMSEPFTAAGTVLEVSPEACALSQDIAARIDDHGGAALIVDYGEDGPCGDSLRGFYKHTQVDVLSRPGEVDVTMDVDFKAIRGAVEGMLADRRKFYGSLTDEQKKEFAPKFTPGSARVFGPVPQGSWLMSLGIVSRVEALIEQDDVSVQQANELFEGMKRLVQAEDMGLKYKVLAMVGGRAGKMDVSVGAPPGFE